MRILLSLLLLVAFSGCPSTNLDPDDDDDATDAAPPPEHAALTLSPEDVDVRGHCTSQLVPITVSNPGEVAVEIAGVELTGGGWTLGDLTLPVHLEPGADWQFVAEGTAGVAVLVIESDSPITPSLSTTLTATTNQPPVVTLVAPADGTVDEGADLVLSASVEDEDVGSVLLRWTSDVDGLVADVPVSADGTASTPWAASDRAPGGHLITATATDLCGETHTETAVICQQGPLRQAAAPTVDWHYEGSAAAAVEPATVQLTDASPNQFGAAFDTSRSVGGGDVVVEFEYRIGGGNGADGFALTALDTGRATGLIGSGGGCLGYGWHAHCEPLDDPLFGWSVEFDTYRNLDWDPTGGDHVAFAFDGDVASPAALVSVSPLDDDAWHTARVEVTAPHVLVLVDDVVLIDEEPLGFFDFDAQIGFSAATGQVTNEHQVRNVVVTGRACPTGD